MFPPASKAPSFTKFSPVKMSQLPEDFSNWGITEAFYRFKSIGSSDIDVDDLEKVLSHLSYLKIDPQAGALKTSTKKHQFLILIFWMFLVYRNWLRINFSKHPTQSDLQLCVCIRGEHVSHFTVEGDNWDCPEINEVRDLGLRGVHAIHTGLLPNECWITCSKYNFWILLASKPQGFIFLLILRFLLYTFIHLLYVYMYSIHSSY